MSDIVIKTTQPQGQNELVEAHTPLIDEAINGAISGQATDPLGNIVNGVVDKICARIVAYINKQPETYKPQAGWAADTTAAGWAGISGVEVWNSAKDKGGTKLSTGSVGLGRPDVGRLVIQKD